jgi:hypothetical protein
MSAKLEIGGGISWPWQIIWCFSRSFLFFASLRCLYRNGGFQPVTTQCDV